MADFQKTVEAVQKQEKMMSVVGMPLLSYIAAANEVYKSKKGDKRNDDIAFIEAILKDNRISEPQKIVKIQEYLHSSRSDFSRGYSNGSFFADCINAAIYCYQSDLLAKQTQTKVEEESIDKKSILTAYRIYELEKAKQKGKKKGLTENESNFKSYVTNPLNDSLNQKGYEISSLSPRLQALIKMATMDYTSDEVIRAYHSFVSRGNTPTDEDTNLYTLALAEPSKIFKINNTSDLSPSFIELTMRAKQNLQTWNNAYESVQTSVYTLADYYLFAIERYRNSVLILSEQRKKDVEELIAIIQTYANDNDFLKANVHEYFASENFRKTVGINSQLEKFFREAEKDFYSNSKTLSPGTSNIGMAPVEGHERNLQTRTWLPTGVNPSEIKKGAVGNRVVVLAMHGLADSLATWEGIAGSLAAKGVEVISYDQAGHGYDELRQKNPGLDLKQMQYDFYAQLRKLQADPAVAEIHLLGHSLGGALLANSMATIDNRTADKERHGLETTLPNKIKSVTCVSPAMMNHALLESVSNLPTLKSKDPGDKGAAVQGMQKPGLTRGGGGEFSFQRAVQFVKFVSSSFQNLRKLASGQYRLTKSVPANDPVMKEKAPDEVSQESPNDLNQKRLSLSKQERVIPRPWYVMSGTKDKLVSVSNFKAFTFSRTEKSRVEIETFSGATHHAHGLGSVTQELVADRVFNNISKNSNVLSKKNIPAPLPPMPPN